jgi:Flp pilus assembly secretin CpaC
MMFSRARVTGLNRALLLSGAAALWAVLGVGPVEAGDDFIVKYDQSQILRLPRPAAEVIVGNPSVADVSVQSGNILVVTGKTFGITNMIALDTARNVIQEMRILVKRDEASVINLQRGTQRQSYNCTPQCNPSIIIGDDTAYFDTIHTASQKKITFSERAADSTAQNANQ